MQDKQEVIIPLTSPKSICTKHRLSQSEVRVDYLDLRLPVKKDTAGIALSALGGRRGSWGDRGLRKGWCKLQSGAFRLPDQSKTS